jgi:hypothetical protein
MAHLGGDLDKAGAYLKDVYNCRLYDKLKVEFVEVDYAGMVERTNKTKLQAEVACGGGACEL